mmetsp:Transcript_148126/g.412549  ORF Transcript_148126/g.412549 Transcript_148126/m.412549 type:complete len:124 (+) Transcript_148126:387-758(+)
MTHLQAAEPMCTTITVKHDQSQNGTVGCWEPFNVCVHRVGRWMTGVRDPHAAPTKFFSEPHIQHLRLFWRCLCIQHFGCLSVSQAWCFSSSLKVGGLPSLTFGHSGLALVKALQSTRWTICET